MRWDQLRAGDMYDIAFYKDESSLVIILTDVEAGSRAASVLDAETGRICCYLFNHLEIAADARVIVRRSS